MNISQIIFMLLDSANTLEREVVCNDDFDGNDDVADAIEDIRNAAKVLKTMTGVDSKEKAKREEHVRNIEAILKSNIPNKEFQYFFAFTASEKDSIHCFGCSDKIFDANLAVELTTKATRCMRNPAEFCKYLIDCVIDCVMIDCVTEDEDDD